MRFSRFSCVGSFEVPRHIQGWRYLLADDANAQLHICAAQKSSGVHQFLQHAVEQLSRLHKTPGEIQKRNRPRDRGNDAQIVADSARINLFVFCLCYLNI